LDVYEKVRSQVSFHIAYKTTDSNTTPRRRL
jgi:hypothetical protein